MQNAGQQYGQGGASSHQTAPFGGLSENTSTGGSITSSLRQFRRKNEDKQSQSDNINTTSTPAESHVARVAPHSHYPPRSTAECYRYAPQYPDYGLQQPVKYSEISEPHPPLQEHISPSVIQKAKSKDYMDMCNVQQQHIKQPYDHLNNQQVYPEANIHSQYLHKETQGHHGYKPESQYYPKDPQYSPQLSHQVPKYNMPPAPPQVRKYPPENDFLSKLRRIHPSMARSIMSDHHLQETQSSYQSMDQNRMYLPQNQRYMNYPTSMQNSSYGHGYMPPYSNYPTSCSYNRPPQMTPRFPPVNPHERSISPRRGYPDNMSIPMNYGGIPPQKISPNYAQYNAPEYAQHYQHRRAPMAQEYYQQHCRPSQYLPHQMPPQEISEGRVTVSDNIKHYIENWADEETASEMNQMENSRLCKDGLRGRDDPSTETVYMINASELQYLENDIPLVTSENGVPVPVVTNETGQYIIKSVVNSSEMVRIMEKTGQVEIDHNGDRVVNLHIMDTPKSDCMLANKQLELNQRSVTENNFNTTEKPRVLVHQNTVITTGAQNSIITKETDSTDSVKIGTSLPIITDTLEEELNRTIIKECRKETADKNCSPITLDQLEQYQDDKEIKSTEENSLVEEIASIQEMDNSLIDNDDTKTENENHHQDDDPHKHIDSLLENTIHNSSEAIEENNKLDENNAQQIPTNISIDENSPITDEFIDKNETEEIVAKKNIEEENVNKENQLLLVPTNNCVKSDNNIEENTTNEDSITTIDEIKDDEVKEVKETNSINKNSSSTETKSNKRSRRIFSVDDIINNIGKKSKLCNTDHLSRRHSIQCTKEFLDKEITNTFKFLPKKIQIETPTAIEEIVLEIEKPKDSPTAIEEIVPEIEKPKDSPTTIEEIVPEIEKPKDSEIEKTEETQIEKPEEIEIEKLKETIIEKPEETLIEKPEEIESTTTNVIEEIIPLQEDTKKIETPPHIELDVPKELPDQPEVQYRNVIRVEESNVLLEIGGELVEITINRINGKNLITVVPLSDTAVVDFNDNYEMFDNPDDTDPLKLDEPLQEQVEVVEEEEEIPEPEIVETTSEIIIGMDLSLEEEIKLDVDQPILCTKAAKKAYDSDLQIPSITTSDDVLDNTRSDSYISTNDKVSSTKEKSKSTKNKIKKTTNKADSSKSEDLPKRISTKQDKKSLFRDLIAARNKKKLKSETSKPDEDDFVPFKELIRARRLKKLKLQKIKNSEDSTVDSTIKIDETNHKQNDLNVETQPQTEQKLSEIPTEKPIKRVSFSEVTKPEESKTNGIIKSVQKKKLSLEEYNRRKRKLQDTNTDSKKPKIELNPEKINKLTRPKSLDDINMLKPKEPVCTKRKLSLEYSPVKQNYFDWEETQSPKINLTQNEHDSKLSEFKGLIGEINTNKAKVVIDINDFNMKPPLQDSSEDEILQNYKEQVESKLSSLNIQIPKPKQFLKPETNDLIGRFLKNEKLNIEEMDKIRKIISYKRLVQQLKKIKSPIPVNPAYEVRKDISEKDTRLLLKKIPDKKKTRFRNLYSQTDNEPETDIREKSGCGDYSVVQSNCLAGVVPKLIIKRKTEMPVPVVRLERLDLGILDDKNKRYAV